MSKIEGTYYHTDPTAHLQAEASAPLNDSDATEVVRLLQLCTVGGVLLITQLPGKDGAAQPAFITILAAPSAATYSHGVADAGPISARIWDKATIADLPESVDSSVANYPILGAQAPIWSHYIGLLVIPWIATHRFLSDSSPMPVMKASKASHPASVLCGATL
jgi:hypothetical protein